MYLNSKLKNFKKRYSRTNLGLVSYNKRFLCAGGVSAPGSVHDSRLIKSSSIFECIMNVDAIPKNTFSLGDFFKVRLVTIGDSAIPSYTWLLKCYETTQDNQKRHLNSKLRD